MDHIQNRPMDGRSIVAKENVNPLSNDQNSHCEWSPFLVFSLVLLLSQDSTPTLKFNAGYQDYLGGTTDLHVGYEGGDGAYSFYLQGGPAIVMPEGVDDTEMELSGKFGGSVASTENVGCLWRAELHHWR